MKRKIWLIILTVAMLIVLFAPIPTGVCNDGGTRTYTALTYKIVNWRRLVGDETPYEQTRVYWFPNNFKPIDELWSMEKPNVKQDFVATLLELQNTYAVVQPLEGEWERLSSDKISFSTAGLGDIGIEIGDEVRVYYTGEIMESYPARISAVQWEKVKDLRHRVYTGQWLNKETAEKQDTDIFDHIVITEIYSDCFFATPAIPMPWTIKLNGELSEDWCVGDQVICTYENVYRQDERIEADLLTIAQSDWEPEPGVAYKPVIYLYPEEETEVSVKLSLDGRLTCTYPAYNTGWKITAAPDGTLTDAKGQTYNYLYWEGQTNAKWDMTEGFCVKGEDTAVFLEEALEKLGLTRKEANEFIVYWLPLMEQNPYNIISFQQEIYTDAAKLTVAPAPDTIIRVFMAWQGTECYVNIKEQVLSAPERTGFTVVEWGGTEVE